MVKKHKNRKVTMNVELEKRYAFGTFKIEDGEKVSVSFDFSKAEVPKDTFSASYAYIKKGPNHDIFMIFVQLDAVDGTVKHNLQVKFDDLSLVNAWINSKDFYRRVSEWYKTTYNIEIKNCGYDLTTRTQSYQVTSNLVFFGHQENSAIVAFYYFDPRAARDIILRRMPNEELIGIPVVQIKMSTFAVWSFLDDIKNHVGNIITEFPILNNRIPEGVELKNE
jgi:hypothetical protein